MSKMIPGLHSMESCSVAALTVVLNTPRKDTRKRISGAVAKSDKNEGTCVLETREHNGKRIIASCLLL